MRRPAIAGIAALATALVLTSCASAPTPESEGPTLRIGTFYDQASFDPADAGAGHPIQYMQPVYDSLVRLQPDGTPEPMLATAWEYDEARTELTLTLRDDVTFSDGTELDADAVVANLERARVGSGSAAIALGSVSEVAADGEYTVTIGLTSPDPALVQNLGQEAGFVASPAAIEAGSLVGTPTGSGPYVLDEERSTRGSEYVFTRNPGYWQPEMMPYDELVLVPLTTEPARMNALASGQIDAVGGVAKMIGQAESAGMDVYTAPGDWQGLHIADRAGEVVPALADVRVRQAINYAIDAQGILDGVRLGYGERSTQLFSPTSNAWVDELSSRYPHDPAKARELLVEAGYPDGFDLPMLLSTDYLGDVQSAIEQGLAEVGIRVQWTTVPLDEVRRMFSGEFPVFYAKLATTPLAWKDLQLALNGPYNAFKSSDPKIDELMSQIAAAPEAEQGALYQELNTYIVEQAWFDVWYVQDNVYLADPSVEVTMQSGQIVPSIYNYAPRG